MTQPSPQTAPVRTITRYWGLTDPTVRKILDEAGIRPVSIGPERYAWRDIWRVEGTGYVAPADEREFRRPLLSAAEIQAIYPDLNLKLRTITDRALKRRWPAIRLGSDWRFRECEIRKAVFDV